MAELSFRVDKQTSEARKHEIESALRLAYNSYAVGTKYPGSRHTPPLLIEPFPSENPYTEHGKVKSVLWLSNAPLNEFWLGAAQVLVQALANEFPERGAVLNHDKEGSALKVQPKKQKVA